MPRHGPRGREGSQRSLPTGGAAYGMPRNWYTLPFCTPRKKPSCVRTMLVNLAALQSELVANNHRATIAAQKVPRAFSL